MTQDDAGPAPMRGSVANGWISVTERLPEENRVLMYCPLLEPDEIIAATRYKSGLWVCDDGQMLGATEPTHWMPLPAPPTDRK
jgi:hypothetical protein